MPSGGTKASDRTKKRQESYTHCEYIAASLEWLGKLTKQSLLEASGEGAGKYCEDKQRRDQKFNATRQRAFDIAEATKEKDARKNKALQKVLLELVDLSAAAGNLASQQAFRRTYLKDDKGNWYPHKWMSIPTAEGDPPG